jgi:hypothetical protein
MSEAISDLSALLASLHPVRNPGVYVFTSVPADTDLGSLDPIATFRANEGLTLIVKEQEAGQADLPVLFRAAWITLTVHSDLQAVGLTAAVAAALTDAGIACNVVAAAFHDHLFVPVEAGERAFAVLQTMAPSVGNYGSRG